MKGDESDQRPTPRADPFVEMLYAGELMFKLLFVALVIAVVVEFV